MVKFVAKKPINLGQNDGFKIENWIIQEINGRRLSDVSVELQKIIKVMGYAISIADSFSAFKKEGRGLAKKTDITIFKNGQPFSRLSVKSGSGNSVHQENIFQFVEFLNAIGANKNEIDALLFFHWGDGTRDGSGRVTNRLNAREIKSRFPEVISVVDGLIEKFKIQIVTRALQGDIDGTEPEYLLYCGNSESKQRFLVSSLAKVIEFHNQIPEESSTIKIGNLNLQNWNRCLMGQENTSHKHRNDIQFKWVSMLRDMEKLSFV